MEFGGRIKENLKLMFSLKNDQEGLYTKPEAYALVKRLLGVDKKVCIKKDFFKIFFEEDEHPFYKRKCSEQRMTNIFEKHKLKEKNLSYWEAKLQGAPPVQLYDSLVRTLYEEVRIAA